MNPEIFEVKLDKNNTYKASIDMTVANAAFEKIHGKVEGNADLQAKLQSFIAQLQAKVADFNQRLGGHRVYTSDEQMRGDSAKMIESNNAARKALRDLNPTLSGSSRTLDIILKQNQAIGDELKARFFADLGIKSLYLEANGAAPRPAPTAPSTTPDAPPVAPPTGITQAARPSSGPATQLGSIGQAVNALRSREEYIKRETGPK